MRITEIEQRNYLHGDCAIYAIALAKNYGWELVGIFDSIWTNVPRHVGAITPEGYYADVRSYSMTTKEFLDGFNPKGNATIKPISVKDVKRIYHNRDFDQEVKLEAP